MVSVFGSVGWFELGCYGYSLKFFFSEFFVGNIFIVIS